MIFWTSWYQDTEDFRPLTFPPNEAILGWWCSGFDSDNTPIIVAMVNAENKQEAEKSILKDWPEALDKKDWRFFEEKEDVKLGDRWQLDGWMEKRINEYEIQ